MWESLAWIVVFKQFLKKGGTISHKEDRNGLAQVYYQVQNFTQSGSAAAKSLPSCPTLCDPTDGSPPGSSIPGILQARVALGGRKLQNPEGGSAQSTSMYIDCIAHCIPSKTRDTQNILSCSLASDSTFRMFTLLLTIVGNCTSPNTCALGRRSPSSLLPLTHTVF